MNDREHKGPDAGATPHGAAAGGEADHERLRKLGMQRKMMLRKATEGKIPHAAHGGGGANAHSLSASFSSTHEHSHSGSFELSSASVERVQKILELPDEVVGSMESAELKSALDLPHDMWAEMEHLSSHSSSHDSSSSGR
jgi:hypothetical protein